MAIYKVTYQISGESTYRDVNVESDHALTTVDNEVIEVASRDSVNFTNKTSGTSLVGIRIVSVTEVI
ncbi:hypothetical protein N7922_13915 [Kosakonia sp. ML.JS2a]|uniref:hypothetical protein n=1 Tax=Kosakonia sp. ML.JS2a TaxID=2980557 RepID=UPI0021DAFB45|nr:hypothetical protein [Kosakonia sp. ML.JS2a]UXY08988.1 hypothetical protein N7922_13915 [Kosakonia sp. ML.JS2a]